MEENIEGEGLKGMEKKLVIKDVGMRYFINRIYVPKIGDINEIVLDVAHRTRYSIHPGEDKMYLT